MLEKLATLERFLSGSKSDQSELIVWCLYEENGRASGIEIKSVVAAFETLHLPRANPTRLKAHFRKSRNIRTLSSSCFAPTLSFMEEVDGLIEFEDELDESILDTSALPLPPFVDQARQTHLANMVRAYSQLFLLENSMRGLIEHVLKRQFGDGWWEQVSNAQMRKKHNARVENERSKKWAPARTEFGPLYALDWPDLITLMRK